MSIQWLLDEVDVSSFFSENHILEDSLPIVSQDSHHGMDEDVLGIHMTFVSKPRSFKPTTRMANHPKEGVMHVAGTVYEYSPATEDRTLIHHYKFGMYVLLCILISTINRRIIVDTTK